MTPLFALVCAVASFWAGLYLVGWQFLTGVVWLGGCIAFALIWAFDGAGKSLQDLFTDE